MPSCERCGNELPDDAKFCDGCGARYTSSLPSVRENPQDSPAVRALLQRAEGLRAAGDIGAALDLVQEAAEKVGHSAAWARIEYSMRANIARSAVENDQVGDPLPGVRYDPMQPLARIETELDIGPTVNPAVLAFTRGDRLISVPSGVFSGGKTPLMAGIDRLLKRGEARSVPLPDMAPTRILCDRQGSRIWVAGNRSDGGVLLSHDPKGGWSEVLTGLGAAVTALSLGAQGRRLVVGTDVGQITLLDIEGERPAQLGTRFLTRQRIVRCGVAADGDVAFAWSGRGEPVLVGPVIAAGELKRLEVPHRDVTDVRSAAGGRLIATIDEVGQLCFFRIDNTESVGQVHLPVLQDPQMQIGGTDYAQELAVVRPGGNALHCYEFRYLVFVGEPAYVVRTKPEKLDDGGRLVLGTLADFIAHYDGARIAVFAANMRPVKG